jgi:Tol biopolymer transport system component
MLSLFFAVFFSACTGQADRSDKLIAFMHYPPTRDGNIYILDLDTGIEKKIVPPFDGFSCPVWSPDGENLLLVDRTNRMSVGADHDGEIYLYNLASEKLSQLPIDQYYSLWDRSWSPDGSSIIFSGYLTLSEDEIKPTNNLYEYDLISGSLSQITPDDESDWTFPRWSPIGDEVLALRDLQVNGSTKRQLVLLDPENNSYRVLMGKNGDYFIGPNVIDEPSWSPDGKRIAYTEMKIYPEYYGCSDIFIMDVEPSHTVRITACDGFERNDSPTWSADGEKIFFSSNRDHLDESAGPEKFDIYMMNIDGTDITRLTTSGDIWCPVIQP